MTSPDRPYLTWTEAVTCLAFSEPMTAPQLRERIQADVSAGEEAYLARANEADNACRAAGISPNDENLGWNHFASFDLQMVPKDLPYEKVLIAHQLITLRDAEIEQRQSSRDEFRVALEQARERLIEAAQCARLDLRGKSKSGSDNTKIPPEEFEFLNWNVSDGGDVLLNGEENTSWRQVTLDREQFNKWHFGALMTMDQLPAPSVAVQDDDRPASKAEVLRAFEGRVKQWPKDKAKPSETSDLRWLQETIGKPVKRSMFREIRPTIAPAWCRRGRPSKPKSARD